jgi:hypothetical protein
VPSPNGYFSNIVFTSTQRTWTRIELQYNANNPPWDTPNVGNYTITTNIGPVGGPYTLATTTTVNPCTARANPAAPGGLTSTFYGIGAPAGQPGALTPGTNYEVEVVLQDVTNTEVDRWAVPLSTDPYPTTFSQSTTNITQTTADVLLGNAGQSVVIPNGCDGDQVIWDWATVPGGPYTSTPIADIASLSPSTTLTGLPANTQIFWRARLFDDTGALYYTSPEASFTTEAAEVPLNPECLAPTILTDTSATVQGRADEVAPDQHLRLTLATVSGGPYTAQVSPGFPGTNTPDQTITSTFSGLTPATQYFYRLEVRDATNALVEASTECTFTTAEASVPPFNPEPCPPGGSGAAGADVEQMLLCDTLADGTIAGTAMAVWEYDAEGNAVGAPTFVDPATGTPYVAQGTLRPCPGETGCLEPVSFHRTTTSTGPVEHPGRMYDITLPINPGFAVQSLQVDQVTNAANIVWEVDDPDGEAFRQNLTTFIEGRVPASATVTITNPNAGQIICGTATPMTVHIECVRLDEDPPDLIELIYNGGQDMILNPAYNETPPLNPPVSQGNYGYHLLSRQDDPGPFPGNPPANDVNCTNVANRGWETNDVGRTFEIWGQDVAGGVTPTPRGTPIQEITSDGPSPGGRSTIWQTFQAPASANFIIRVVHGARDAGEQHRITLDNGDTNDAQNGTLINDVTNPPTVYGNPWTQFNQTIPLIAGQTYTLALSTTNPVAGARGGLFTDMRAYIDRPDQRATAVTNDDTCSVTVDETTTACQDELWSPICDNGVIESWQNAETGEILANAAFWGQAPAPVPGPCPATAASGDGGSVAANLAYTYQVCSVIGGVRTTLQRQIVTDASGGVLADAFIGPDGGPVPTPTNYTIGSCTDTAYVNDVLLCDVIQGQGTVSFLRKYIQSLNDVGQGQINSFRDFDFDGNAYTVQGVVASCEDAGVDQETVCWTDSNGTPGIHTGTIRHQDGINAQGWLLFDQNATLVGDTSGVTFVPCGPDPTMVTGLCLANGTPIGIVTRRTAEGVIVQDGWTNLLTGAFTAGNPPAGTQACGDSTSITTSGLLCDIDGGGNVVGLVIVQYEFNPDGSVASTTLLDAVTGAVYVPTGTVTVCPTGTEQPDADLVVVCDDTGSFLRDYRRDETGTVVAVSDYTLAGAAYVPVGTVRTCVADVRDTEVYTLCDVVAGVPIPFLRRQTFDLDGTITATVDTTPAGAPYAVAGTVQVCGTLDTEPATLCDVQANGTVVAFRRRYTFNATTGLQVGTNDTTLDGSTPYAVTGTVSDCNATVPRARSLVWDTSTDGNWTPAAVPGGSTLLGLSGSVIIGSATTSVTGADGNVITNLPTGFTFAWSVGEDPGTLTGPTTVNGGTGRVLITYTVTP